MTKNISVVIPTLNEEELLPLTLESLFKQKLLPLEIIIVDGGSDDKTQQIVKKWMKIFDSEGTLLILEKLSKKGITLSRDYGYRRAKGKYICSCDADTWYPLDYLQSAEKWMKVNENKKYVGVIGNPMSIKNPPWYIVVERVIHSWRIKLEMKLFGGVNFVRAYNIMFSREAYLKSSGMNVFIYAVEDEVGLTRCLRERGKIGYCKQMRPLSSGRRINKGFWRFLFKTIIYDYWGVYWLSKLGVKDLSYKREN